MVVVDYDDGAGDDGAADDDEVANADGDGDAVDVVTAAAVVGVGDV